MTAAPEWRRTSCRRGQENKSRYLKPELLIVDDMGMKQLPGLSGECLFAVVMRR